jgi:DNA-binding FadR family transcriptional regulator
VRESPAIQEAFAPLARDALSDRLVASIRASIQSGAYQGGDRLPSIPRMARSFRVGAATVREAIIKLEMMRIVEVRHGTGVFVR